MSVVIAGLEVTTPGEVELVLNSIAGLKMYVDKASVPLSTTVKLNLTAGPHSLSFSIDRAVRKEPLRVELQDVKGSAAQVQIISGK